MGYLIAFILGIFVATVGLGNAASVFDKGIVKTQEVMKEATK